MSTSPPLILHSPSKYQKMARQLQQLLRQQGQTCALAAEQATVGWHILLAPPQDTAEPGWLWLHCAGRSVLDPLRQRRYFLRMSRKMTLQLCDSQGEIARLVLHRPATHKRLQAHLLCALSEWLPQILQRHRPRLARFATQHTPDMQPWATTRHTPWRHLWYLGLRQIRARFMEQYWQSFHASLSSPLGSPAALKPLPQNDFNTVADPNVLHIGTRRWYFAEVADQFDSKGRIAYLTREGQWQSVLENPAHLSFPHFLQWQQQLYMLPENGDSDAGLYLYQAEQPSGPWQARQLLLPGAGWRDPVLHHHQQRWWLWVSRQSHEGGITLLHLFSSERLFGPWQAHPQNPISSDIRCSRNGGQLICHDGLLIRVAQDSSRHYGWAIRLMQITHLSSEDYRERCIRRITPAELALQAEGMHTWNWQAGELLIDARQWRFKGRWRPADKKMAGSPVCRPSSRSNSQTS